jgi:hypothetical protein
MHDTVQFLKNIFHLTNYALKWSEQSHEFGCTSKFSSLVSTSFWKFWDAFKRCVLKEVLIKGICYLEVWGIFSSYIQVTSPHPLRLHTKPSTWVYHAFSNKLLQTTSHATHLLLLKIFRQCFILYIKVHLFLRPYTSCTYTTYQVTCTILSGYIKHMLFLLLGGWGVNNLNWGGVVRVTFKQWSKWLWRMFVCEGE